MRKIINTIGIIILVLVITILIVKPTPQKFYNEGKEIAESCEEGDRISIILAINLQKIAIFMDESYVQPYYEISNNLVNLAYRGADDQGKDVYDQITLSNANTYLRKAETLAPNAGELHRCKAYVLKANGHFDDAIKEIEKAIAIEPENPRFHKMYGVILLELYFVTNNKYYASQSIKEFTSALELNPSARQRADILDFLGLTYHMAFGKYREAIRCYERALLIDPKDWITLHHYKVAKMDEAKDSGGEDRRQKNYAAATREFSVSENMKALYNTAKEYASYGDYVQAENVIKQVIIKEPKNFEAYALLGEVYFVKGDLAQALEAFSKAIKINNKYALGYSQIGYIQYLNKDLTASLQNYFKAVSLDPNNAAMYYNISYDYQLLGDEQQAISYCQKAIEADPKYDTAYYGLGVLVGKTNKLAAVEYFQQAVNLGTSYENCYIALGDIYIKQKEYYKAAAVLEKALSKNIATPWVLNGLAWCYVCLDTHQENAVNLAFIASLMSPDRLEIIDTLNKAYINLSKCNLREGHIISSIFNYFMSLYVWINTLFGGFLFILIVLFIIVQFLPRLFICYSIKGESLRYLFLRFIPLMSVSFQSIEEIRLLKRFEGLKYIIHQNWRNRLIGKEVLIKKKEGFIKNIILTPGKADKFIEQVKEKINEIQKQV